LASSRSFSTRRRRRDAKRVDIGATKPDIPTTQSRLQTIAWWTVAVALCGAAWGVDPFADAAFDAPKRLCVLAGAVFATAALLWRAPVPDWRTWSKEAKWIAAAVIVGVVCVLLSTFASPHPELAWPSLRRFLIMALFAIIGASRLLDGAAGARMFIVFLIACVTNALISLAQSGGMEFLPIAQVGGRFATGALLGNEGYVALACAMMAAVCVACAVNVSSRAMRVEFILMAALGLWVMLLNQQKTALIGFVAALLVIVALRWRMRWLLAGMAGMLALGTLSVLIAPLRAATWGALPISSYQQLTTYRLGAWIAATDMTTEHPLTGFGLGTFAAEAQTHRLAAELRIRERLNPPTEASFVYAHQDYLQLAAESGIPALLLFLGAIVALFGKLASQREPTWEQQVLLAIGATGMIVALSWFPMHIPFTACVLLLCAGRAWRLIALPREVLR